MQISITHRDTFQPIRCGIELACVLRDLYPDDWKMDKSMRLLCDQAVLDALKSGASSNEILKLIAEEVAEFKPRRERHLLY